MVDKDKKRAHIIFKRLKACGFNIEVCKQRFGEITVDDKNNYNKFYSHYLRL